MSGKIFADSNVMLYLVGTDAAKRVIAKQVLYASPVISTQVVSECINVLLKKAKKPIDFVAEYKSNLEEFCAVAHIDSGILSNALLLKDKYGYQWYDSIILATALANDCTILYSEDMQHGRVVEGSLTIVNPFLEP